jgi:hypothetical protein
MEKKFKTHCNFCSAETNHLSLFSKIVSVDKIDLDSKKFDLTKCEEEYSVVECQGCNSISFLVKRMFDGKEPEIENFPESFNEYDSVLGSLSDEDIRLLPRLIHDLYTEVEEAIDNYSLVLAGIGLRTLVEAVCIDQKIKGVNLQSKIKELQVQGFISKYEEPILDKLRQIGNVSAHEIKNLPINKLEYAMGIINHILRSIYVLPKLNKKLNLDPKVKKKIRQRASKKSF